MGGTDLPGVCPENLRPKGCNWESSIYSWPDGISQWQDGLITVQLAGELLPMFQAFSMTQSRLLVDFVALEWARTNLRSGLHVGKSLPWDAPDQQRHQRLRQVRGWYEKAHCLEMIFVGDHRAFVLTLGSRSLEGDLENVIRVYYKNEMLTTNLNHKLNRCEPAMGSPEPRRTSLLLATSKCLGKSIFPTNHGRLVHNVLGCWNPRCMLLNALPQTDFLDAT